MEKDKQKNRAGPSNKQIAKRGNNNSSGEEQNETLSKAESKNSSEHEKETFHGTWMDSLSLAGSSVSSLSRKRPSWKDELLPEQVLLMIENEEAYFRVGETADRLTKMYFPGETSKTSPMGETSDASLVKEMLDVGTSMEKETSDRSMVNETPESHSEEEILTVETDLDEEAEEERIYSEDEGTRSCTCLDKLKDTENQPTNEELDDYCKNRKKFYESISNYL